AVFLVWPPAKYAQMLGEKLKKHGSKVWLLNTGWSGGAYGVGKRMKLSYTRAMVAAILSGKLNNAKTVMHPVFGLAMPTEVEGVPSDVLDPRKTWSDGAAYDEQAAKVAKMFAENIKKFSGLDAAILGAGPKL